MLSFSRHVAIASRQSRLLSTTRVAGAEKTLGESLKDSVTGVAEKLKNTGSIGSKFEKGGDVAEVGEKVGGPFSSDGAVGKQFSAEKDGIVGGTGQKVAESAEKTAKTAGEPKTEPKRF